MVWGVLVEFCLLLMIRCVNLIILLVLVGDLFVIRFSVRYKFIYFLCSCGIFSFSFVKGEVYFGVFDKCDV